MGGVGISGVESTGFVIAVLESGHETVTHNSEMRVSLKTLAQKIFFC